MTHFRNLLGTVGEEVNFYRAIQTIRIDNLAENDDFSRLRQCSRLAQRQIRLRLWLQLA